MTAEIKGRATRPETVTTPIDGEPRNGAGLAVMVQDLADQIQTSRLATALNYERGADQTVAAFAGVRDAFGGDDTLDSRKGMWIVVGTDDGSDAYIALVSSGTGGAFPFLIEETNPKAFDLNAVVFEPIGAKYIAAGEADGVDAYVVNSLNPHSGAGATWTERANPKNFDINALATDGAGVVVGAGVHDGGDIYTIRSLDSGDTWSEFVIAGAAGDLVDSIAWGGPLGSKVFVAVGRNGATTPLIWTSPDGITWTPRTPGAGLTGGLRAVVWNGTVFVAAGSTGEIQTSPDGITWTVRRDPTTSPDNVDIVNLATSSDGLVLANALGTILYSGDDGVTWVVARHARQTIGGDLLAGAPWGFLIINDSTTTVRAHVSQTSR